MKTGKSLKALILAGLFVFAFTSYNAANAQRRQLTDCIVDGLGPGDARYSDGLVERFEDPRDYPKVRRNRREDIYDKKETLIDLREERRHRRF